MTLTKQTDPASTRRFCEDSSGLPGGHTDGVFFPRNTNEIGDILREARATKTPVSIAGNGTGLTGARIPFGGWVLATERMDRIFEIGVDLKEKEKQGYAVVEPGVTLSELKTAVSQQGWTYRPDPTESSCFLGATVATNASGSRSFLWGSTRQHVRGLDVVLASGDSVYLERGQVVAQADGTLDLPTSDGTLRLKLSYRKGPATTKNSAGYYLEPGLDAVDLFIGQEGTLGVITRVEVRLFESPASEFSGIVFFNNDEEALSWGETIKQRSRASRSRDANTLQATAIEYMDEHSLDILRTSEPGETRSGPSIPLDARAAIYFEQAVTRHQNEDRLLEDWLKTLEAQGVPAERCWLAQDARNREQLHEWRHQIPMRINERLHRKGLPKIGTDLAVPDSAFPELWRFYQQALKEWGGDYAVFGHLGDSHLHINLIPDNAAAVERGRAAHLAMAREAVRLGGTVSAEHGIGKSKHALLQIQLGDSGIAGLRAVKKSLDPEGILSPGNVFPV